MTDLEIDVRKYLGLTPFDNSLNIVMYDVFFLKSLYSKYGEHCVSAMIKMLE